MDRELVKRRLGFTRRKKKWIILLGLTGFSSFVLYKLYNTPSVVRKGKRIVKLLGSLVSVAEMVSESAETISVVSRDLKEFLKSDSDEIPNSLKQLSKIARSEEFSESLIRVSQAMTIGILKGYHPSTSGRTDIQEADHSTFSDRVMDKLMSSTGTGFVSVIVGSLTRNLVMEYYADRGSSEGSNQQNDRWVDLVMDDKGRVLVSESIKTFVSTAVAVYLDKTKDINFYDEMFSGLTNPKHQNEVKDVLVSLCNGAVETLVKTSHEVLTASKSGHDSVSTDSYSILDQTGASILNKSKDLEQVPFLRKMKEMNRYIQRPNSGWVNSVSSTLAAPRNIKFVLGVTGRVTFESVRSLIEFFLWKTSEVLKRSIDVVRVEVLERGLEVVRYVGAKSSVILTICLALFLHVLGGNRAMLPA